MAIRIKVVAGAVLVSSLMVGTAAALATETVPGESKRLARAKDFIAEEQWMRAIEVLHVLLRDVKETGKDEALYWLAHSLKHSGDSAGALSTIRRLEYGFPSSLWVKPAGALRLEIAVRLGRSDVLWLTAAPPPPPPPPLAAPAPKPAPGVSTSKRRITPPVPPPAPPESEVPPAPPMPTALSAPTVMAGAAAVPVGTAPASVWLPDTYQPDSDLRIQALRHLIQTDAEKAIPILKAIAFETTNPASASRAVFVLAQSQRPEARETVVQVAQAGPSLVRVAAVRELGLFGGADVSRLLLHVYPTGDAAVKRQVLKSLGERADRGALFNIAQSEGDRDLRTRAILTLGQAGGGPELRLLYTKAGADFKRPIILGLFNARAENELIHIATLERDQALRQELFSQLRLLGTPKAKEYLQKVSQNR